MKSARFLLVPAFSFLLVLCVTCFGIRRISPFPAIPQVRAKLEAYAAEGGKIDTLFFGSSRVYSGIIPKLFDEVARTHGLEATSYNLGIDAMAFPESEYLCERALARWPGRVRLALVEITRVNTEMPPQMRGTRRASYWHDLRRTGTVARSIWERSNRTGFIPDERSRDLLLEDFAQFFLRLSNFGDGADLVRLDDAPPPRPTGRDAFDPSWRGYYPMDSVLQGKDRAAFEKSVAEAQWKNRPQSDTATEDALRKFARRLAKKGTTAVFVLTPNYLPAATLFGEGRSKAGDPEVLSFDDPETYPELYRPEVHADPIHLNDAGAREFTVLLSQRIAELKMRRSTASPSVQSPP